VLASVVHWRARPGRRQDLQRLVEHACAPPVVELLAGDGELAGEAVAAEADPERQPTAREPVERTALLAWLRARDAVAIEDDYDAEYRYDRAAVRALQGREPDRIVYAGSASKTLAPALRLGWLVVPPRLLNAVADEKDLDDCGTARIEQQAFADFLARGELDRHLRRMRAQYRRRRDLLVEALADALPEATVRGIAAGLHATVQLPDGYDEQAILDQARRRRIGLTTMRDFWVQPGTGPPTLLLGYDRIPSTPSRPPCANWPRRPGQPARRRGTG
jgi:GntR family transcriptional regulator/MocR family aminotransferase